MNTGWPRLTQKDLEWKLAQLEAYCSNCRLHKTLGPALELSTCVAGRSLLEFIGIRVNWQAPPYELRPKKKQGHDVNCEDFGIAPFPIETLSSSDREILSNFIIRAHRIAHFTRDDEPDRHNWTCLAVPLINRLFKEHFYDQVKDRIPIK